MKGKIIPSVAASILSILTIAQAGVSAVGNEASSLSSSTVYESKKELQREGFISRNIEKLTAGALFLTAAGVYLMKPDQISEYEKELRKKSKEELMEMLPDVWREFWAATYAAAGTAAGAAAWKAGWEAGLDYAWRSNGLAYNMVKDKNKKYFVNLLKVLHEQTEKLSAIVDNYQRARS